MRKNNLNYQITVPNGRRPLSGIVAAAAVAGLIYCYESDTVPEDTRKLVPASGKKGAILERDVLSEVDWQAHMAKQAGFPTDLKTPLTVGDAVSARYADFAQFEGATYLDAGITTATPVDTPLTTANGKLVVWDSESGDEIVCYLRRFITKQQAGSACRIEVEFV